MTDSTRRSGRATKGQHPRLEETEVPEPSKKTGRGRKKNTPTPEKTEQEKDEVVRCICECSKEDAEDGRNMVCCEECKVWQHFECMDVREDPFMDVPEDQEPPLYFCEQCRPADHKELLGKIKRGEKPWQDRITERERVEEEREREQKEEEKKSKKTKGKKGKKGRQSTTKKEEMETNGATVEEDTVMTDAAPEEESKPVTKIVPESPVSNGKRKHVDEPSVNDRSPSQSEPVSKLRKAASSTVPSKSPLPAPNRRKSSGLASGKRESNPTTALQTEQVERIDELQNGSRQKIAAALLKLFEPQVKQAQKDGTLALVEGQDTHSFALSLALRVEYALYLNFFGNAELPSSDYKDKFSAINHNVKANASLRDRLLNGELSPNDLSRMSRADMASKELQEKKAEMLKEAEKQHILKHEEGPRIRRTHKGEEIVETEANDADNADTTFSAPIRKRPSQIDTAMRDASPDPLSATDRTQEEAVELPEQVGKEGPEEKPPLKIDTDAPPNADAFPERKSSSTFNIQNVWSGVPKEPDPERARRLSRPSEPAAPAVKQQPDADIDRLLQEPEEEDDAYSPVDFVADPSVPIWHGKMSMPNIATFHGRAKYAAGANLSASIPWSQLLYSTLTIEGRIDTTKADEYLCGLRYSTTTDLSVVAVTTNDNPDDQAQFDKLFKYFTERKRYGVISKNPVTSVKDTYVVPLEAGAVEKPGFIELLDDCHIDFPPAERVLLLSFVIKMNNSPGAQQTPRAPDVGALNSPITANHSQPTPIGGHPGFQHSPTPSLPFQPPLPAQPYNTHAGSPPQPQAAYMPPLPPHQAQTPPNYGMIGMEAAHHALGSLVTAPVIGELLKEAPNSGVPEFRVVRELLQNVPASQTNFTLLRGLLTERLKQGANGVP